MKLITNKTFIKRQKKKTRNEVEVPIKRVKL
jgi:hypothetical protein